MALLLGNGLMVSKGDLWKRQRRMIQPTFNHESIGRSTKMIIGRQYGTPRKWQLAAQRNESVNITRDVSSMALEVVLRFILGDDYEQVGFHFDLLSQEPARNMEFAMFLPSLREDHSSGHRAKAKGNRDVQLTLWACSCRRATRRAANSCRTAN